MYLPQGFDGRLAKELGELVAEAYAQFSHFEDGRVWEIPPPYTLVAILSYSRGNGFLPDNNRILDACLERLNIRGKNVQIPIGFVARKGHDAYIIFRGTQTAGEWISNLNAKLVDFSIPDWGAVHEGFLTSWLSLRDQLRAAFPALAPARRIHIGGHSLGSAFAVFTAADLGENGGRKPASVYTFGSPRVGDDRFAQRYNILFGKRTYRVANTSDIVTEIPFPAQFLGFFGGYYSHVDTPVVFTVQNRDIEKNHEIATYIASVRGTGKGQGFFRRLFGALG